MYIHLFGGSGANVGEGCRCVVAFCAVINEKLITMNKFRVRYILSPIICQITIYVKILCVCHIKIIFSSTIQYLFGAAISPSDFVSGLIQLLPLHGIRHTGNQKYESLADIIRP